MAYDRSRSAELWLADHGVKRSWFGYGKFDSEAWKKAVSECHLEVLAYLKEEGTLNLADMWGRNVTYHAIANEQMEVLRWLRSENLLDVSEMLSYRQYLHLDVLKWMYYEGLLRAETMCANGSSVAHKAAEKLDLDALKWLHSIGLLDVASIDSDGVSVLHVAAASGDYDKDDFCLLILKWFDSLGSLDAMATDSLGQNLAHVTSYSVPILKWLRSQGKLDFAAKDKQGKTIAHLAAWNGNVEVLEWLFSQSLLRFHELDDEGKSAADYATNGRKHSEILVRLFALDPPPVLPLELDPEAWLIAHGVKKSFFGYFSEDACFRAVELGNLRVLQWLYFLHHLDLKPKKEDHFNVAHCAAIGGRIDVLQWLLEQELFSETAIDDHGRNVAQIATIHGHLKLLEWMHTKGLLDPNEKTTEFWNPGSDNWQPRKHPEASNVGCTLALIASRFGRLEILEWLHKLAMLDDKEKDKVGRGVSLVAAWQGHLNVLDWLYTSSLLDVHAKDCEGENVAHIAAVHGHLEVLQWLRQIGLLCALEQNRFGRNVGHLATWNGHLEIVAWLYAEGLLAAKEKDAAGWTISHFAASPTGRNVAFIKNGNIRLMSRPKRLEIIRWLHSKSLLDVDQDEQRRDSCPFGRRSTSFGFHAMATFCWIVGRRDPDQRWVQYYSARYTKSARMAGEAKLGWRNAAAFP